jgi:hypothetical protein
MAIFQDDVGEYDPVRAAKLRKAKVHCVYAGLSCGGWCCCFAPGKSMTLCMHP